MNLRKNVQCLFAEIKFSCLVGLFVFEIQYLDVSITIFVYNSRFLNKSNVSVANELVTLYF